MALQIRIEWSWSAVVGSLGWLGVATDLSEMRTTDKPLERRMRASAFGFRLVP